MLPVNATNEPLQRHFKFSAAIEPSPMDAVAGAINVASPDALETHQNVATHLWPQLFQLIGEPDRRGSFQMGERAKGPFVRWPIARRNELHFMAKIDNSLRQALQIRFRATARRIAAPHKTDVKFSGIRQTHQMTPKFSAKAMYL